MNLHRLASRRAAEGRPVRVGLIGAGKFDTMYLSQALRTPGIHLVGVADLQPVRAKAALKRVGWPADRLGAKGFADAAKRGTVRVVDDAFAMIAEHPLAMPKLCFEITESVALHDLGSTRRFVDRVRMYGSKLALDDFGAGYTSFNYLKEIPADFIKIDGGFIKEINRNPANYAITRMIVDLTHELGMRSIAEWAETPDTIASLYDLGVDYGQGFALARAMDREPVTQALSCGDLVKDAAVLAVMKRPPLALARTLA